MLFLINHEARYRPYYPSLKGSGTIKAGFAGQDHPKCYFPSLQVALSMISKRITLIGAYLASGDQNMSEF